ncbi:hypothetical protein QTP86_032557 [Hemibagrus guttatus]|nr:hypothetical protein QTP86_032557 [Hemibagrus guttatus]
MKRCKALCYHNNTPELYSSSIQRVSSGEALGKRGGDFGAWDSELCISGLPLPHRHHLLQGYQEKKKKKKKKKKKRKRKKKKNIKKKKKKKIKKREKKKKENVPRVDLCGMHECPVPLEMSCSSRNVLFPKK